MKETGTPSPKRVTIGDALFSAADLKAYVILWLREQIPLFEALWLAAALHVLAFPFIWFIGWALPWPETSIMTTVVELDLSNWPEEARPKRVIKYRDPDLNR